jgi:glycine cleavage system H lipoate-binding protein
MRCPFLREAQVRWCVASAYRKMIVRSPTQPNDERCSSSNYTTCPVLKQHHQDQPNTGRCPFLQESLVQYCGAASVTKYIPYSESALSQCGSGSHTYCDLFIAIAQPPGSHEQGTASPDTQQPCTATSECVVDGIRMPARLWYSPNHMWLDVNDDGMLHVGIDAFLATILGSVDNLTFLTQKGWCRPSLVFTVQGVDLQMAFPNPIMITKANAYLRTCPSKLLTDPYSVGWLFEGMTEKSSSTHKLSDSTAGLSTGEAACQWMRSELKRMTSLIHEIHARPAPNGDVLMADGGTFSPHVLRSLDRKEIVDIFNEFLSPFSVRRTTL